MVHRRGSRALPAVLAVLAVATSTHIAASAVGHEEPDAGMPPDSSENVIAAPGGEFSGIERLKLDMARRAIDLAEANGTRAVTPAEATPVAFDAARAANLKLATLRAMEPRSSELRERMPSLVGMPSLTATDGKEEGR